MLLGESHMRSIAEVQQDTVGVRVVEDLLVSFPNPLYALTFPLVLARVRLHCRFAINERLQTHITIERGKKVSRNHSIKQFGLMLLETHIVYKNNTTTTQQFLAPNVVIPVVVLIRIDERHVPCSRSSTGYQFI